MIDSLGNAALIAAAATSAITLPALRYHLNIADEGYLWHGTLQVLDRKIPIRDFRAYDPFRYYWCALWCRLFGPRNLSIRVAMLVLQFGGLWLALILVHHATDSWGATALWAIPICASMRPWFRQFECTAAIATIFAGVVVVAHPAPMQFAAVGVCVGLGVAVGLNFAVYSAAGLLIAFVVTRAMPGQPTPLASPGWYLLGVAAGLSVLLLVFAAIPRFLTTYWRVKIAPMITRRSTNLSVPVPWLWRTRGGRWTAGAVALRVFFTALPIFYAASLVWILLGGPATPPRFALFAVSICVGAAYAHQAFSRADAIHALSAAPPVLLALSVVLFRTTAGTIAAVAVAGAAVLAVIFGEHPLARLRNAKQFGRFTTRRDTFWVRTPWAATLEAMRAAVESHSDGAEPVLFAPILVTLYPLLERTPAVYDLYSVYPATERSQLEMIASITAARVRLALVWNLGLDGRDDLRFSNTHPLVWRHLEDNFDSRPVSGLPSDMRCFVR